MEEILKLSALEMAAKIKSQQISSEEIVASHIRQIKKWNPQLNALVEDNFQAAELAARKVDQLAQERKPLPPLAGVPFTIKEMLAFQGFKRTAGSIHTSSSVSSTHATIVQRMLDAGAIPLGTSNVPELGFWFETNNVVYGRTNNPYDITRTCGGSSGGEGALVGSGASPLGLGSDIGGSIRMPAFFCGVFGHKPTNRTLPLTGHYPYNNEDFEKVLRGAYYPYTSVGPLARKAKDLRAVVQLLKGPDSIDKETLSQEFLPSTLDFKKLKVFVLESPVIHGTKEVSHELQQAVSNVAKLFSELGAKTEEVPPRLLVNAVSTWFGALKASKLTKYHEQLSNRSADFSVGKEMLKLALGKANYTFPSLVVSLGEVLGVGQDDTEEALRQLVKMRQQLSEMLGPDGILILPPHSRVAPAHGAPYWTPFDFVYTGIFNVLGFPATSVPMGLNNEGLPLGVQIVSNHFNDSLNFAVAEFLEETFGGWVPPADN